MWEELIQPILEGSPWALLIVMGLVMRGLYKTWRSDVAELVGRLEGKHTELDGKDAEIRELEKEKATLMVEAGDKVLKLTLEHNTEIRTLLDTQQAHILELRKDSNDTIRNVDGSLKTLTAVIQASAGG